VIVTHSVSNEELNALYNSALMVVQPSRYEGFGYPVVEAMRCGTPVITTTTSSLPEIAGDAAVLVDPDDGRGFADAIEELYNDPDRRKRMSKLGLKQAELFSPEQLGRNTLETYKEAAAGTPKTEQKHVAVWSSFPPLLCGIADYTSELLQALSELCKVEVFIDGDFLPATHLTQHFVVHHNSAFDRRHEQEPFDSVIYQMGGSYFQEFMFERMQNHPGIVVLHDLLMGAGVTYMYHQRGRADFFARKIIGREPQTVVHKYEEIFKDADQFPGGPVENLFDRYFLLKWIMDCSLAQIVHMQPAADELMDYYDNANVYAIEMGVVDPWSENLSGTSSAVKAQYGIAPSTFLIGIFGSVIPNKQIESCLKALRQLVDGKPDTLMIIVGHAPDMGFDYLGTLKNLAADLNLRNHVRFMGRLPREDFDNLFLASDVILNLRYPSRKGMSATLIRTLAAGKPVAISDIPEWRFLPEEFCWRVKPGKWEVQSILEFLHKLATNKDHLKEVSQQARIYFETHNTVKLMAAQYLDVIEATANILKAKHGISTI
jgi:glycosyltransferase involved in cell wall biosynthesis